MPFILPPRVRVPSTPSTLLLIFIDLCNGEKTIINEKRPGLAHFLTNCVGLTYRRFRRIVSCTLSLVQMTSAPTSSSSTQTSASHTSSVVALNVAPIERRTSNVEAVCVKRRLFFGEIEPSRSSLKVINYYRFMHCPRRRSVRLIVLLIQADFLTSLMLLLPTSIHQRNTKNIKDRQIMSHPITAPAADDMLNIDLK